MRPTNPLIFGAQQLNRVAGGPPLRYITYFGAGGWPTLAS
jgi:hypothetical protein